MWLFAGENYLLLARIHNEKMMVAAISIAHEVVSIQSAQWLNSKGAVGKASQAWTPPGYRLVDGSTSVLAAPRNLSLIFVFIG
jgi:hypothetical protein